MAEQTLRYVIEQRWRKPPPAPYSNPWQVTSSYDEMAYAQEGMRDDMRDLDDCDARYVWRVRDTKEKTDG